MVNWQEELKKYTAKNIKAKLGVDVSTEQIENITISIDDLDLPNLENKDLSMIYAFAIMDENFEQANIILNELKNRNCSVRIDTNDVEKSAIIALFKISEPNIVLYDIKMKILLDGMIIDFEKQNF